MTIYLVRHGLAAAGADDLDPGLAPLGHEQAHAVAAALAGIAAGRLLVSPLRRTRETALPIARELGLPQEIRDEVAEVFNPSMPAEERRSMIGPFMAGRWAEQTEVLRAWRRRVVDTLLDAANQCLGGGSEFLRFCDSCLAWFDEIAQPENHNGDDSNEPFAVFSDERIVWTDLKREIIGTIGEGVTLEAFLQELQMRSKESIPSPNMVPLFTIHASKGKEFDHVYLVGLVEDELPSFQAIKKGKRSPELEEERRNCFVAITRTSKTLTLSYAENYNGWSKEPSRFLFEMGVLK